MINYARHIDYCKGLRWDVVSDQGPGREKTYRAARIENEQMISFATITTRPGGLLCTFAAKITILGHGGKEATSLHRTFEGRNCQYSARKWAEVMLFFPPSMVVTHMEL